MDILFKNRYRIVLLFLLSTFALLFPRPSFAGCSWDGTWSDVSNTNCSYKCRPNYGGGGYGGIYVSGLVTENCIQSDPLGNGQYNVWAEFTQCSSDYEAKQFCAQSSCTGQTDCSIFPLSADRTCCNAVNSSCSQCLHYNNACTPPEISNIDWACVYANNCEDSVWATGCRNIPASTAPKCNGSLPVGTYYPGQVINVGGEVILKNTADPAITSANVLLGSTYVNWNGLLTTDPPTSCNPLKTTGVKKVGSFNKGPFIKFNDTTINVTAANFDTAGLCNADPYRAIIGGNNACSSNISGCSVGTATAAHNPSKVNIDFDWLVPNISQSATAQVTGANGSGTCSYTANFNISALACQNLRVGDGSGTILTPAPGTVTTVRFTSTNPKSSYTASATCTNGLNAAGFPYSYTQSSGSTSYTNYDYIDDNSNKKSPDGTNIISYAGGGWQQIPVNNDPNTDSSRHFNNRVGKTVTVYFIGSSVTVYGWAWERTARNTDGTVTKPEFSADIDGAGSTITDSYLGNGTCTFRAPTGNPARNTHAPICTISPTNSRTGIRKLTLTTLNDHNLYFDGVQITAPFILPFTVPTNVPTGSCTFSAAVTNNYNTTDACSPNFTLNITGRPNVAVTIDGAPVSCQYGNQVNTSATVTNSGTGNAASVSLDFKFDGTVVQTNNIGTLNAGASVQYPYSRPCTDATTSHTITAQINPVTNDTSTADDLANFNYQIVPRPAFFQSIGGGITSLGTITSTLPSIGDSLSKNTVGHTDAGIISAKNSPINRGLGIFSQNGTSPGWNRLGLTSMPRLTELNYNATDQNQLYDTVLTNAGVNPTTAKTNCGAPPCSYTSGAYTIAVYYNPTDLNTFINTAPTTGTTIIIPGTNALLPTLSSVSTVQSAGKRIIVFTSGNLTISGNVNVSPLDNTAALVFIVNGNITVNDVVSQLDGLYLFNGTLNSNSGPILSNQLLGNGSLIGTGATPFNLRRTYGTTGPVNPAELWTYQGKYLWLFRNILTRPSYSWKELPPQ